MQLSGNTFHLSTILFEKYYTCVCKYEEILILFVNLWSYSAMQFLGAIWLHTRPPSAPGLIGSVRSTKRSQWHSVLSWNSVSRIWQGSRCATKVCYRHISIGSAFCRAHRQTDHFTDSPDCLPILLSISVFYFVILLFSTVVVPCCRLIWLMSAFERTLK